MHEAQPLVSIITPTFNRADFLVLAAQTVISQTHPGFEWIIVDDGSTDDTYARMEALLGDDRIRYIYQENSGQNNARNRALDEARGEFICFLDSDDLWASDKLERQLNAFREHPDVDIVHGDEILIDWLGNEISRRNMRRYSGMITAYLLADNSVSITTAMVRRRCFDEMGGFSRSYPVADDYELWLRFSTRYRYLYVPAYFAFYRVMDDQISSDKTRRFEVNERILQDFLRSFQGIVTRQERSSGLAKFYARRARYFASERKLGPAIKSWFHCFRYAPISSLTWRTLFRCVVPAQVAMNQSGASI